MAEETITEQTPEIDPGMSVMPEGPGLMDVPTVIPELGLAAQALASQVSFAKKTWKDGSGGGTPVTAAELNRLEQGVADLTAAVNALRDSVSQICGNVEVEGYDINQRIGIQMKSKVSNRRCVFGLTSDNRLYINSQNESGVWNDARYI